MDSFQLQNFVPGFAPVRNNLRLSGAEPHTVVDADRAGVERHCARDGVEVNLGISCSIEGRVAEASALAPGVRVKVCSRWRGTAPFDGLRPNGLARCAYGGG